MNRIVLAPTVLALTFFTTCANANIDQLKGLLGGKKAESTVTSSSLTEMATSAASNIDLASLVSSVAGNLNVSENQSEGGIASIMNYVQGNLSGADYDPVGKQHSRLLIACLKMFPLLVVTQQQAQALHYQAYSIRPLSTALHLNR